MACHAGQPGGLLVTQNWYGYNWQEEVLLCFPKYLSTTPEYSVLRTSIADVTSRAKTLYPH